MTANWNYELVGIGLYTLAEAERLTGVPRRSVRRWLTGYDYSRAGTRRHSEAVWTAQIPKTNGNLAVGFLDLMEVRFVHAFREHGVSWRVIRLAAERAKALFSKDHPFSTKRFKTDGRRIFAEIVEQEGETTLLDLVRNQYGFHKVISPSLYAGLEFSDYDAVVRWYPLWPKTDVVIDPARAFGRPIAAREGVPTEILATAVKAEDSIERVARWYDVSPNAVRAAVSFERTLAA